MAALTPCEVELIKLKAKQVSLTAFQSSLYLPKNPSANIILTAERLVVDEQIKQIEHRMPEDQIQRIKDNIL